MARRSCPEEILALVPRALAGALEAGKMKDIWRSMNTWEKISFVLWMLNLPLIVVLAYYRVRLGGLGWF